MRAFESLYEADRQARELAGEAVAALALSRTPRRRQPGGLRGAREPADGRAARATLGR